MSKAKKMLVLPRPASLEHACARVRKKIEESNQFSKQAHLHGRVRRAQQQPRHFLRRALEDINAVYCLQDVSSLQQSACMSKAASFVAMYKV